MKYFIVYTLCFSAIVFVLDSFIFWKVIEHNHVQDIVIQPVPKEHITNYQKENGEEQFELTVASEQTNTPVIQEQKKESTIFLYEPDEFQSIIEKSHVNPMKQLIEHPLFEPKIQDFVIILYQNKNNVRGNMKNRVLRLYELERLGEKESFAVFLHELWHYIDLYHFKKYDDYDMSHEFYSISWDTTKVMKAGMTQLDFVSWYAASNSYEDFSESFLYFILHNRDFEAKAEENSILKKKYDFFANVLFVGGEFQKSDFSVDPGKSYNRDTTKIDFSLENFLEYLKKSI